DLDPYLVNVANTKYPEATFEVADLADFALYDTHGALRTFDIVVSAGNVQAFLAAWERIPTLQNIAAHMHGSSRFLTGFQLGRGYSAKKDRKSTRLNSSHVSLSYAVFCLKKKHKINNNKN